ncbi:acyltransferase [Marinospirillum minutulum]|uniref:acyltransferase n=1 Tax=Marinospirillum minutulum TaxID=64974 RepID=UPI0003FA21F0|nr:acyltransferase [Marinospirillum minutulum]
MAYLTADEIKSMGFKQLGENILLSNKASYYNCKNISIGNNVRVDDFCVLSAGEGGIEIGNFVHIAVYTLIIGSGKITFNDFSGASSRVSIYSSNDDYSGSSLTNPMIPKEFADVNHSDVFIGRHVIIGSGSVILPGVNLHEGVAIGALSLVIENCEEFSIYAGNPAKKIKNRKRDLLEMEGKFLSSLKQHK